MWLLHIRESPSEIAVSKPGANGVHFGFCFLSKLETFGEIRRAKSLTSIDGKTGGICTATCGDDGSE